MACFPAAGFDLDASVLDILESSAVCVCLANSVQYRGQHCEPCTLDRVDGEVAGIVEPEFGSKSLEMHRESEFNPAFARGPVGAGDAAIRVHSSVPQTDGGQRCRD